MALNKSHIARAHHIASELESEGYSAVDGGAVLSMALGIFMEGQPGSHRHLEPLTTTMLKVAQTAFDALRAGRERDRARRTRSRASPSRDQSEWREAPPMTEPSKARERALLSELDKNEWRDVARLLRPDWTEKKFDDAWREFCELKRRKGAN